MHLLYRAHECAQESPVTVVMGWPQVFQVLPTKLVNKPAELHIGWTRLHCDVWKPTTELDRAGSAGPGSCAQRLGTVKIV